MRTRRIKDDLKTVILNDFNQEELINNIVALANKEGGDIILNSKSKNKNVVHDLRTTIISNTVPPVNLSVKVDSYEGQLIKIKVPKSSLTSIKNGRYLTRRINKDGVIEITPVYPFEFEKASLEPLNSDLTSQVILDSDLDDLSSRGRNRLRHLIKHYQGDQSLLDLTDLELDKELGLVKEIDGEYRPTVSGLLLIGREERISELLPTAQSSIRISKGQNLFFEKYSKPLLETFELFLDYFKQNGLNELNINSSSESNFEYSELAFREGLVNALIHRDYTRIEPVEIKINDKGITIKSPGPFLENINQYNPITLEPYSRNPSLAGIFKRIGIAENTGLGIDKIFDSSLRLGKALPDYSKSNDNSAVLFIPESYSDSKFTEFLYQQADKTFSTLELFALYILNQNNSSTIDQFSDKYGFSKARVLNILESLLENNLIRKVGKVPNAYFVLKGRTANSRISDEEVLNFIETQGGRITRKEIMNHYKISKDQAYRVLKRLVNKKLLKLHNKYRASYYRMI